MIQRIKALLIKNKGFILYAIFGVLTTIVNMASYHLFYEIIGLHNVLSTAIAWLLAVLFAFITNKMWVFDSKSFDRKTLLHEISTFLGCRIATGLLDIAIMYVAVDLMHWNATIWKLVSNVLVIIINYIASKIIIFRSKDR